MFLVLFGVFAAWECGVCDVGVHVGGYVVGDGNEECIVCWRFRGAVLEAWGLEGVGRHCSRP